MKALVLEENAKLVYQTVPDPAVGPHDALVRICACGICGSDIGRVMKNGAYHYPLIPGHEFSGVVERVGAEVKRAAPGDRVTVFPMLPCGKCANCRAGHYNMCSSYDYFGSRRDGGYAEYLAVPEWNLVRLPDALPLEVAAMSEPVAVAVHAIRRGNITLGQTVGISGAGTIGLTLSRLAKLAGAREVVLWDIDPEKVRFSQELGNRYTLNSAQENPGACAERELGGKLDLVIEGTGASGGLQACIGAVRSRGRLVLMGNPAPDQMQIEKKVYSSILRNEIELAGTWNSDYLVGVRDDWQTAVSLLARDSDWFRRLISHRFSLQDEMRPFELMIGHRELFCKVMFLMNGNEA